MIRVLHCMAGLGRGGYETLMMNVYRKIDRRKIQFDFLYSFDGVYCDEVRALGGKLYKIPFITQRGPFRYRSSLLEFFGRHPEYRIVHSHMDKFSGLVTECAKIKGIPVRIAHSHNTDSEGGIIYKAVKNYYGLKIARTATHRLACSEAAGKWLFGDDRFTVVKNGIDGGRYKNLDTRDRNFFTVGHVGRFTRQKNHDFLIDTFRRLSRDMPRARLFLAGSGELMPAMREKAEKLGLGEKIKFFGDCDDIPSFLARCDAFCMPSLFEGLGIALVEAQAAGLPCLASDRVPKDADFSGDVKFMPLSRGAGEWARELKKLGERGRSDNLKALYDSGYDISRSARFLRQFYTDLRERRGDGKK